MLKTPHFWAFWAKKADFGPFLAKKGSFSNFFGEKAKTSLFTYLFFIFQYKKSENSNVQIFGKMGTYKRTYGGESKSLSTPSRDQKHKQYILQILIKNDPKRPFLNFPKKLENVIFFNSKD